MLCAYMAQDLNFPFTSQVNKFNSTNHAAF